MVTHDLNTPFIASYIRFVPTAWHGHISMRVELYGCPIGMSFGNFFLISYGEVHERGQCHGFSVFSTFINNCEVRPSLRRIQNSSKTTRGKKSTHFLKGTVVICYIVKTKIRVYKELVPNIFQVSINSDLLCLLQVALIDVSIVVG